MTGQPYPYYGTKKSVAATQADIHKLLYKHGAQGTRWTEIPEEGLYEVEFLFPTPTKDGGKQTLMFRVRPTLLMKRDGTPHPEATMRMVLWWLKTKMEAITYGLRSVEQEFLAEAVHRLESGEEVTVGEVLIPRIFSGDVLEPGTLAKRLSPPDDKEEEPR